jgi:hypothetical protein
MDDMEISFGERIVRLDGTVLEVFARAGVYDGVRIPVNFLGVTAKTLRNGDVKVGLGWRSEPYAAGSSADVFDQGATVQHPAGILELSPPQWSLLQPLLAEAAVRRTLPAS